MHIRYTTKKSVFLLARVNETGKTTGKRLGESVRLGMFMCAARRATLSAVSVFNADREKTTVLPPTYSLFLEQKIISISIQFANCSDE